MKTKTATAKQLRVILVAAIQAGIPVLVFGAPGCGKTTIANQAYESFADYFTGGIFIWSTTNRNAIDLGGLYRVNADGKTVRCPIEEVSFNKPVFILIDELGDCPKFEQSGYYRLVNEKELGDKKLFAGSYVCAASNREDDGASARPISSALKKRMQCVTLVADSKSVLEHGFKQAWNSTVLGFISCYPETVDDGFNADLLYSGCTPRSLEQLSKLENADLISSNSDIAELQIVGLIDHDLGSKYLSFRSLKTPSPQLVFNDPKTAPQLDGAMQIAYQAQIVSACQPTSLKAVLQYSLLLNRVDGCSLAFNAKCKFGKKECEKLSVWTEVVLKFVELV